MSQEITTYKDLSFARGLDLSVRAQDIMYLEAAREFVDSRFDRISHYDYRGSGGVLLDLSDVTVEDDTAGPLRQRSQSGSSYEFWEIGDYFSAELMNRMANENVPKLTSDETKEHLDIDIDNFLEGVALADITEAGIIAYPADINYVFNPENILTPQRYMQTSGNYIPKDEVIELLRSMPSHVLFPPTWATQEFYHTDVGGYVLRGAGYNMREHKKRKMGWQSTASTPMPQNSARGTLYTDFQEGSTSNYYGKAADVAMQFSRLAGELGKIDAQEFWECASDAFRIVGREEAGHRTYIRGTRRGAVKNGDSDVCSYAYREWANEIAHVDKKGKPMLYMPGLYIDGFVKGSVKAERAKLYGRSEALRAIVNTIDASFINGKPPSDLTPEGEEAVERLLAHKELVSSYIDNEAS